MEPRKLLEALRLRDELSVNALAAKVKVPQSQLQKFCSGNTREPRRTTLQPVADYFRIPVEAFYDADLARQWFLDLGLEGPVAIAREPSQNAHVAAPDSRRALTWPFRLVSYSRIRDLPASARDDIDKTLDVLVTRWEAESRPQKRRPSR